MSRAISCPRFPYVLIDYTNPDDGRPSMRAFRVLREKDVNGDGDFEDAEDISFDYTAIAGTPLQPPLPLSIMEVPFLEDGTSANTEVTGSNVDPASNIPDEGGLPEASPEDGQAGLTHYNRFTYEDRNGAQVGLPRASRCGQRERRSSHRDAVLLQHAGGLRLPWR